MTNILAMPLVKLEIETGNNEDWVDSIKFVVDTPEKPQLDIRGIIFDMEIRRQPTDHEVVLSASTTNETLKIGEPPDVGFLILNIPVTDMRTMNEGEYVGDIVGHDEEHTRVVAQFTLKIVEGVTKATQAATDVAWRHVGLMVAAAPKAIDEIPAVDIDELENTMVINDTSAVVGGPASFYNPVFYGQPGTGKVHRLNRLFVGSATLSASDVPASYHGTDWLSTYFPIGEGAQFISTSTIGELSIVGAVRTSDFRTWTGNPTGGAQAITGFALNDTTGSIACGVVGINVHDVGCDGVTLHQLDTNNLGDVVDVTPYGNIYGGQTYSLGLTPGAYDSLGTLHNVTAAMYIGGGNSTKFRKGIVVLNGALDTSVGNSGNGVAIEFAESQAIRWLNYANSVDIAIWGSSGGLIVAGAVTTASSDFILHSLVALTGGDISFAPTLTTGPRTGDPTKWLPYDDGGTTRYIPAW